MSDLRPPVQRTTDQNPERKRRAALPISAFRRFGVSAFTLVEMMVVVGIIVLLVSITLPAIGPMLASNEQAQVSNTLSGLLVNGQALAAQTATCVGLRIERAFKTDDFGLMVDAAGRDSVNPAYLGVPVLLDHQQARFVTLAAYKDQVFRQTANTRVYELPKNFWLAPDYALSNDWPVFPGNLTESALTVTPSYSGRTLAPFNRLETFYILFSSEGELVRSPAQSVNYADQTQQYMAGTTLTTPYITHPDQSTRGVFVYDRRQWNDIPLTGDPVVDTASRAQFLKQSWPININRVTGSAVQETNK